MKKTPADQAAQNEEWRTRFFAAFNTSPETPPSFKYFVLSELIAKTSISLMEMTAQAILGPAKRRK